MSSTITELVATKKHARPAHAMPSKDYPHLWFWWCEFCIGLDGFGWEPNCSKAVDAAAAHVTTCSDARAMLAATAGLAS